jgi:hypothetical protein
VIKHILLCTRSFPYSSTSIGVAVLIVIRYFLHISKSVGKSSVEQDPKNKVYLSSEFNLERLSYIKSGMDYAASKKVAEKFSKLFPFWAQVRCAIPGGYPIRSVVDVLDRGHIFANNFMFHKNHRKEKDGTYRCFLYFDILGFEDFKPNKECYHITLGNFDQSDISKVDTACNDAISAFIQPSFPYCLIAIEGVSEGGTINCSLIDGTFGGMIKQSYNRHDNRGRKISMHISIDFYKQPPWPSNLDEPFKRRRYLGIE